MFGKSKVSMIAAVAKNNVIGDGVKMGFNDPEDMAHFRVQEVEVVYRSGDMVLTTILDVENSMGTLTSGVSIDECVLMASAEGDKGILGTTFMIRDGGQWIPDECHFKSKSDSVELMDDILKRLDNLQKDIEEVFGTRKPLEK